MQENTQVEISMQTPEGGPIGETIKTTPEAMAKIFDRTGHFQKPDYDARVNAVDTLERDILDKIWTVYNSRFWIGAIHDSDQYKAGVKSLRQVVKLLNGLMEVKKSSPLDNIFEE